jgi:hypothetical protein
MRQLVACWIVLLGSAGLPAQEAKEAPPAKRYGVEPDLNTYPQKTPQIALASILKAIERQRFDYLLAQLAEPRFVDERVKRFNGNFDEVVKETATKLTGNPEAVKEMYRFLREGNWEVGDTTASAQLKEVKDRRLFLRKLNGRWYLENRQTADTPAK